MHQNKLTFTPSLFIQYHICPDWIWHDRFSNPEEKGEFSDFMQHLMGEGVEHEKKYIKEFKFTEVKIKNMDGAVLETIKLMGSGANLIYQGAIRFEKDNVIYEGRPDLLEKRSGKSKLGNYYYVPIDIKSSKQLKDKQKHQLILHGLMLENMQGIFPQQVAIINRDSERIDVTISESDKAKTWEQINKILIIMNGKKPLMKLVSSYKECPWFDKILKEAEDQEDIALIYRLDARAHPVLREQNIITIRDAAQMNLDALPKVPYAPKETLKRIKLQAQALVEQKLIWIGSPEIPDAPLKIYFDIEGDPLLQVQYLFGFWVVGDVERKYATANARFYPEENKYFLYFVAEKPENESILWDQFLEWIKILPKEYFVYHYADYEKSRTRTMANQYGSSVAFKYFQSRLIDFEKIIKESVILPLYFYSIKDIAKSKFVDYKWRHPKAGGAQSIFWYARWLAANDRNILNDIIDYNEDDVRATEFLHTWFLKNYKK
jgi:uncharacterized protein